MEAVNKILNNFVESSFLHTLVISETFENNTNRTTQFPSESRLTIHMDCTFTMEKLKHWENVLVNFVKFAQNFDKFLVIRFGNIRSCNDIWLLKDIKNDFF